LRTLHSTYHSRLLKFPVTPNSFSNFMGALSVIHSFSVRRVSGEQLE
jgi:hypothetical protein